MCERADCRARLRRSRLRVLGCAVAVAAFAGVVALVPTRGDAAGRREVWIAMRHDGVPGSGSESDPFDGSSREKLDALMPAIAPGARIHFGSGTFVTGGIQAKEGWRISGRGKERTTIKLGDNLLPGNPAAEVRSVIYQYDFQGFLRYFELRDLTIDCNRAQQPAFRENLAGNSLEAWAIAAKSARITNVRALGTWSNPGEGFPCRVYHDGSKDTRDRIEITGCENLNPIGSLTAISVFDQAGGAVSGAIRRCLVTDHASGAAFGAGGWRNFEIVGNVTRNVAVAITIDTHNYRNVRIHGNRFLHCLSFGVLCNGGGVYDGIKIYDNTFDMAPGAGPCVATGEARISLQFLRNTIVQRRAAVPIVARGRHAVVMMEGNIVRRRVGPPQ